MGSTICWDKIVSSQFTANKHLKLVYLGMMCRKWVKVTLGDTAPEVLPVLQSHGDNDSLVACLSMMV